VQCVGVRAGLRGERRCRLRLVTENVGDTELRDDMQTTRRPVDGREPEDRLRRISFDHCHSKASPSTTRGGKYAANRTPFA
jgi:hypothetical protein